LLASFEVAREHVQDAVGIDFNARRPAAGAARR
jgi:hypothetical protein